jgi:PKD repeat protein
MKLLYSIAFALVGSIIMAQAPTATISTASSIICSNRSIIFTSTTTGSPTVFTWSINPAVNASFPLGNSQPTAIISFSNPGVFSVSLTVSNGSGTLTTVKTVTIMQSPVAAFSASLTQAGHPTTLNLTNFSTNASTYQWNYSDTGVPDITQDAIHSYSVAGSYSVTLIAINSNGCMDTARYSFYINDSSDVKLPNIFTPNGDGVNV